MEKNHIHHVVKNTGDINDVYYNDNLEEVYVTAQTKGEVQKYNLSDLYRVAKANQTLVYSSKYSLANIDMPNGVTIGHDQNLYITSTRLTSTSILKINLQTNKVSVFAQLSSAWPDGLIYVKEHKQYIVSDNYDGKLETLNTNGEIQKIITIKNAGEGVSPANILYVDGTLHITELWVPSYTKLAAYSVTDNLPMPFIDNKTARELIKSNIHEYKKNLYYMFDADLF